MDKAYIRERITELRLQADISEYQLSLDLGRSKSYIQNITSGKAMPSLDGLIDICDYFNVSASTFFDPKEKDQAEGEALKTAIEKVDEGGVNKALEFIEAIIKFM